MRANLATPIFLALALTAHAQASGDPEDVLARARDKVLDRTDRLPNYTCVQTVDRQYLKREKAEFPVPSCDQMSGERTRKAYRLKVEGTDRLRLDVKVSAGTEIGSWAGASRFDDGNVMKLIYGPFGTGGFGTFLTDIFTGPSVSFNYAGEELLDSVKLFRYRFQVSRDSSHYAVNAGSEWIYTGYDGTVWVDPKTFDLRRLTVRTSDLPEETKTCESTTSVDYETMRVGTGDFLLPRRSTLHFLMRDMTEDEVGVTYSGCHQFLGEAKLVTGLTAALEQPASAAPIPISVPAGLSVLTSLSEPIDTNTAAAGDVIAERVSKAVEDPKSKTAIIPAGSLVRARIVGMQHWLDSPRRFAISIQLETVEIDGVTFSIYARLWREDDEPAPKEAASALVGRDKPIYLRPRGQSSLVGHHVAYTGANHYVMPRGYEMKWITVTPPDPDQP